MNVLEKAEKSIEYLKNAECTAKSHELQASAGTLGRCLGVLGSRPNYARHYANLLHSAIPTLLSLASNDSAEVRLVGDEALNRAVVGGFAFHAYKTNIVLQNQIDHTRNARWVRAALSRVCLGDTWLRPGVGKIRTQAQTLFPKLSQIVRQTNDIQLIVETLENNLPRILNALAEYCTDEEIIELTKALLSHVESSEPAVRRGVASCVAHLCSHRDVILTNIMQKVFDKLWPEIPESSVTLGWFGVIKAVFQVHNISSFAENDLFSVQDYLELYHLCIYYIEQSTIEHNIQNSIMECLTVLLSQSTGEYKKVLLEKHPTLVNLDTRMRVKGHSRNISSASAITSVMTHVSDTASVKEQETQDMTELMFSGALHLGSLSQLHTPSLSVEDLTIPTPDSPTSEMDVDIPDSEQLSKDLSEKLREIDRGSVNTEYDQVDIPGQRYETEFRVNIGSSTDDDIPLKYCARLLASKFMLTGNRGHVISDRSVRVSVKASALNCLSEILQLYPQAITVYLDKDADIKSHNISGSSEQTDSNQDYINDFILERNVCYQDSITDSLVHELMNKSIDSQNTSQSQQISKKDSKSFDKSLEKSLESVEQKSSSKDVQSNVLDSRIYLKNDLIASGMTDSTNPNMTNSNFTSNSNMTASNEITNYPMTSSGDILSSSIDLDMKFDHFGESSTNLENLDALKDLTKEDKPKRPLKRTDEVHSKDAPDGLIERRNSAEKEDECKEFECQHMSDIFNLLWGHNDPQIRGLVRVCIANYLNAALDLSHGDYTRWRNFIALPKSVSDNISTDNLVEIVLKGLTDDTHICVNHTLASITKICSALCNSKHHGVLWHAVNSLVSLDIISYWLCKVNLCKAFETLPHQRLFMLFPGYNSKSKMIMNTLFCLLADQDQKVRHAAAKAISTITPKIYPSKGQNQSQTLIQIAKQQTKYFTFEPQGLALDQFRNMYFYHDLPEQLRVEKEIENKEGLKLVVGDLMAKLMESSCKFYSQGLLEALHATMKAWPPWNHVEAYSDQGILELCLDSLDCCNGMVAMRTLLLNLCTMIYPVEIHNIMRHKTTNREIFERDATTAVKWRHLDDDKMAMLSEKFQVIILRTLNVVVHLIEEVSPSSLINKGAFPGSPVRRNTQEIVHRQTSKSEVDDKGSLRKKPQVIVSNLRLNFAGNFYSEPFFMKLYDNLRATYSNHKINLDPKSSIFYEFLSTALDALAILLELSTEKEFGNVTEEILYYLKTIMPMKPDKSVHCVTQLLKCLFGTNMLNQYSDFMTVDTKNNENDNPVSFFDDVLLINKLQSLEEKDVEPRRNSICSNSSQKSTLECRNPKMAAEREYLIQLENFTRNKMDRKWSTNKMELERYIRLFEPVVIQALKSYTMQNDIPLQCSVLCLLNQLLTLRVNYCMLDSDQIFIGFLLKQLDLVEQHEIPNCCVLVSNILLFLVHLSSSKHHSKQIIELPKLIQLCDGLLASGAQIECVAALERVSILAFSNQRITLGRAQQQQTAIAREVLAHMHSKTMHMHRALELVSCVLALSHENYVAAHWSQVAADTLLSLLAKRTIELDHRQAVTSLERIIDYLDRDVLLDQSRVEMVLKILFQSPPDQTTTPFKQKLRYLSIIMVLLRKVLVLIPETEILLSLNYLKSTHISPQSLFFNVKTDIDPLNVQNVNENCANLSPDVILVRFLFKTLTYAILEIDNCREMDCANLDLEDIEDKTQNHRLLYSVCVNLIVQVKNMLHLTTGCLFPLTAKTAQNILHNEQSGLNTGLYSPEENIPLELLNLICLSAAHRIPLLTVHWSHLLIRLKFLEQKYWQNLLGFVRNMPLCSDNNDGGLLQVDILQIGCFMAYCEYFIENGLSEAVHLTWLLVNRIHILVSYYGESATMALVAKVNEVASASGLLLQAVAARCTHKLQSEFALNTYKILSGCHESQSGALVFLICRLIGKLEPAIAMRFAKLAVDRCKKLKELPAEDISVQLTKEDVQVALEMLQRDKLHLRYQALVVELNTLASSVFDLSPLDLSQDRAINPQYILTTNVDAAWLVNLVKNRCCQTACALEPKISKQNELALLLSNLSKDELTTVFACQEFERKLLNPCFKVACDSYLKAFLNVICVYESREIEKENLRKQREVLRIKEEILSNVDSNKLNVVNTLHVFKKSDNKESKSQFFIPITQNNDINEKFGNLQLSEDEIEIIPPPIPGLYEAAVGTFDKSLTDIIRLFPKQNRPLSQSENFNLNVEQTIDRYTKRCHQVFQDKLFYQEFITVQSIMTGYLSSLHRMMAFFDEIDCDILEKCQENIIPSNLAKNIAIFSVISLQYMSFLIKNKKIVESPVHNEVSFRVTNVVTEKVVIDNVICITLDNVAKALSFNEIWSELNVDKNVNRTQSAISCLYAIVKYFVKENKPLTLRSYLQPQEKGPKSDIILISDKLLTLIEFWEKNFYDKGLSVENEIIGQCYRKSIESLLVSLARLDIVCNIALIPPMAWSSVEVASKKDELEKVDLPLQALQDLDVLESFLFRVNLIGWSSKKQFEEIWVALLAALQGNGTHSAVSGIMQLLLSTVPRVRKSDGTSAMMHLPRNCTFENNGIQRLRSILVGTSAFAAQFDSVNLERIPLLRDDDGDGYHYAQFNTEFLNLASETTDEASYKAKLQLKRMRKNEEVDVNSCLQLLMDVASNMLEPKADTGLAARAALLSCIISCSCLFTSCRQWVALCSALSGCTALQPAGVAARALAGLAAAAAQVRQTAPADTAQELSSAHQKLLKSLTSSYAPLRQAAIQGCLLLLHAAPQVVVSQQYTANPYQEMISQLNITVSQYVGKNARISLYEQSLYWTVLFTLVELGHPELINIAVDFVISNPRHYCTDLVVKGITLSIRQQVLPKELKNSIIEKLIVDMNKYSEHHAIQILMVHLFSADSKLLSPKLTCDVSNMDPDVLMNSMERITLLYKVLQESKSKETKYITASTLKYFLRETLPPAATLSRVVIEFLESCKMTEKVTCGVLTDRERWVVSSVLNAEVVFEVFETAVSQDQLPVLSGWIFEALCHLLSGKISPQFLPYCVTLLLVSATSDQHLRKIAPICYQIIKLGFHNCRVSDFGGIFSDFIANVLTKMSFSDRRLLCIVALHSNYSGSQLERLRELCEANDCLLDLLKCLTEQV